MDGAPAPARAPVSRPAIDRARRTADAAAGRAGVVVGAVEDVGRMQEVVELLADVWGVDRHQPPVRRDLVRAVAHAGGYVAAATAGDRLIGAVVGFLGRSRGEPVLHSHILGVVEGMQGRSVGFALKQHQRWWSLAHGLEHVTWTFDPLVRRNGSFNLNKLGGRIVEYHPSFYGPMDDGINAGDQTDRCLVWWPLLDEEVVRAAEGGGHDEPAGDPPSGRAVVLQADAAGRPHLGDEAARGEAALAAWVPADVVQLRRDEPDKALAWRLALRAALSDALACGHRVTGITRSGWYLLDGAGQPAP